MMTFDEFLIKKKIDRKQFGLAEPALLAEFSHDYAQMGEKSFDHTKKYWFNQLRRRFHLAERPKTEVIKEVTETAPSRNETQVNLVSPTAQPKPAFKPRFVAGKTGIPKHGEESLSLEKTGAKEAPVTEEQAPAAPKPGFKPRFTAPPKKEG